LTLVKHCGVKPPQTKAATGRRPPKFRVRRLVTVTVHLEEFMANFVGKRLKRTEDPRLIKGLAHYVDDIRLPDTLHVAFVRSVYAHARINSIDTSEALKAPGVVAIYTGKDVKGIGPVPCASALPGLKVPDYRVLAQDKVYFLGQPVVAIVARDVYAARDAVDLVMIDYDDLPVVVDVEEAAKGGTVIYEDFGDNVAYKLTAGEGDIDAALAASDHVVKQRIVHQRLAPIAMEGRGVLAPLRLGRLPPTPRAGLHPPGDRTGEVSGELRTSFKFQVSGSEFNAKKGLG
jgi:carbon-monoxide dehydrogenase large subunit